jgi:hypothetical protein
MSLTTITREECKAQSLLPRRLESGMSTPRSYLNLRLIYRLSSRSLMANTTRG